MTKIKYIKDRDRFPRTKQGLADYRAQFDSELQQEAFEDDRLDKAMDAQHQAREEHGDIIDDMSIREGRV